MRLLFIGDVVGRSGRKVVLDELPRLRARYSLDFVVVNGENAAGGFGITEPILEDLLGAGADVVTLGNHVFDQKEALVFIARHDRLLRPINYPPGTPGKGSGMFKAGNGADVLVINAMGLIFMPELGCPFRAIDARACRLPLKQGADAILVDFHAEATSEKQAIGHFSTAGPAASSAPTPMCRRRTSACCRRHRVHVRCRHVRRLRIGVGHGSGGAAQPLPEQNPRAAASSRRTARLR